MILATIFWLLILVGIVLLIVWLAGRGRPAGGISGPSETPLDILKTRYARGEITREEFERMKQDIT